MFKFTYQTRYGDYKDFETVKPSAVLDMVQDVSIRDSENCGYGLLKLREKDIAWLMQGINVQFVKPVKTLVPLDISTGVKRFGGATSERCCIIEQDGEIVAKTVAMWFTLDTQKMRVCKIPPEILSAYRCHNFDDDFFEYKKPELLNATESCYTVRIANKDIDTNKHLNNQKGAEILMDALPFDFHFNNISLIYKKPAYLGDELEICIKELNDGYYVHLQTKEKEICIAGTFENI